MQEYEDSMQHIETMYRYVWGHNPSTVLGKSIFAFLFLFLHTPIGFGSVPF